MRDVARTPEPVPAGPPAPSTGSAFVIQEHHARRLHRDFRLEHDGVLVSWAVPKGPPLSSGKNRLAVRTEDHPLEYGTFEGEIPKGEYGAGTVTIWDSGTHDVEKWRDDEVIAVLHGRPDGGLGGVPRRYALIRTGGMGDDDTWLLHLMKDQPAAGEPTRSPAGDDASTRRSGPPALADLPRPMLATPGTLADVTRGLMRTPYRDRRDLLRTAVEEGGHVHVPEASEGPAEDAVAASRELGLEGIIAKRAGGHYLPGRRGRGWVKVKHHRTQEVVVNGWRRSERRRSGISSLLLAVPDDGALAHVGGVGEVTFAERTARGRLRHAVWRGWRPDRDPSEVRWEDGG